MSSKKADSAAEAKTGSTAEVDPKPTPPKADANPPVQEEAQAKSLSPAAAQALEASMANAGFEQIFKPLIDQKVAAGLTREQAIQVIHSQIQEDPEIAVKQNEAAAAR